MAITITDHRTIRNEADSAAGWTGAITAGIADPEPIEASGWQGANIGVSIVDCYHTGTSIDIRNAVVYCWVFSRLSLGNKTDPNGGLMVMLADGTPNRIAYKVAGADEAAFRHDLGPTGWQCPALDTQSLPATPLVRSGAAASILLGAILEVGTTVNSLVAAPGMNPTYNVDIMRILLVTTNDGCAASIIGGTVGDKGTFAQIALADRTTGNQQAHGLVRELAPGVYGCQGPLRFGNSAGTASSWFEDKNATFVFERRGFRSNLYKFFITDNGIGTTTFRLGTKIGTGETATGEDGVTVTASEGVGWEFNADTDTDVTDVFIYGSTFNGASGGVGLRAGHEFIGGTISASGIVRSGGATMVNSKVVSSLATINTSALIWNVATNPTGYLNGMSFSKGAAAHHGIEFGLTSPLTIDLVGVKFTGFNLANGQNDSMLHFKRTTGTITVTITGGGTIPSYRTDGATIVVVAGAVTLKISVQNTAGTKIQNARALITAGTGGPYPGDVTVTIATAATTASVAHIAHGLSNGDRVLITGAFENELNGIQTISNVTVNAYDYTITSIGGVPGTGTIKSSFVIISGLTDVDGIVADTRQYSTNQPFGSNSRVRKSSASPYYKTASVVGAVSSTSGANITVILLDDE
jgi:hypothetical protein